MENFIFCAVLYHNYELYHIQCIMIPCTCVDLFELGILLNSKKGTCKAANLCGKLRLAKPNV